MTGQREVTKYAAPSLTRSPTGQWIVQAQPWDQFVGRVDEHASGWTAHTSTHRYAGLWPTKQAAAEVLVKQAGFELDRS